MMGPVDHPVNPSLGSKRSGISELRLQDLGFRGLGLKVWGLRSSV